MKIHTPVLVSVKIEPEDNLSNTSNMTSNEIKIEPTNSLTENQIKFDDFADTKDDIKYKNLHSEIKIENFIIEHENFDIIETSYKPPFISNAILNENGNSNDVVKIKTGNVTAIENLKDCSFSSVAILPHVASSMDFERGQENIVSEKKAIIELLELYKDFPCLWNMSDSLYSNKDARNQAFQIILEKWKQYYPLATINDVKKKIVHLRAAYRRERNKVESSKTSGVGVEDVHTPSLWYYHHLNFLHKKASPKSKIVSCDLETNSDHSNIEEPATKIESAKQLIKNSSSGEETSADAFGHSVSSQLKELPKLQRCITEKLIGELLFYAKLGELTFDTSINLNKNLHSHSDTYHYFTQPYNRHVLQYQQHSSQSLPSSPHHLQSSPYQQLTSPQHPSPSGQLTSRPPSQTPTDSHKIYSVEPQLQYLSPSQVQSSLINDFPNTSASASSTPSDLTVELS